MTRENRISTHETRFDRLQAAFAHLEEAIEVTRALLPDLADLESYYQAEWREDFEADEQGLLPVDLKRGILSEDGLYNLLTDKEALSQDLTDLAKALSLR